MNLLDLIILVAVVIGLWRGFKAGLINSMLSLLGWLIIIVLASRFAGDVAPFFAGSIYSPYLRLMLGFLVMVLVVMVVLYLLTGALSMMIQRLKLQVVDKFFGGVLGAGISLLVVLVFLNITSGVLMHFRFFQQSELAQSLMPYAPGATRASKNAIKHSVNEVLRHKNEADVNVYDNSMSKNEPKTKEGISPSDMPSNQNFEDDELEDKPTKTL